MPEFYCAVLKASAEREAIFGARSTPFLWLIVIRALLDFNRL